jgi:Zn ribbon nucleic-acid-binding protein
MKTELNNTAGSHSLDRLVGLDLAVSLAERRERLCRNAPKCDACGETDQIQLLGWLGKIATWKCRTCGHVYLYEPNVSDHRCSPEGAVKPT